MKVKKLKLERWLQLFTFTMSKVWAGYYLVSAFLPLHLTKFSLLVPLFGLKFGLILVLKMPQTQYVESRFLKTKMLSEKRLPQYAENDLL